MKIYAAVMDNVPDAITLKANPGGVGFFIDLANGEVQRPHRRRRESGSAGLTTSVAVSEPPCRRARRPGGRVFLSKFDRLTLAEMASQGQHVMGKISVPDDALSLSLRPPWKLKGAGDVCGRCRRRAIRPPDRRFGDRGLLGFEFLVS